MAKLTIQIGASVDRSLQQALDSSVDMAKRAKTKMAADSKQQTSKMAKDEKKALKESLKELADMRAAQNQKDLLSKLQGLQDTKKVLHQEIMAERAAAHEKSRIRREGRARDSHSSKASGTGKGVTLSSAMSEGMNSGALSAMSKAGRLVWEAGKKAVHVAASIARGAGVSLDPEEYIRRNVGIESESVRLSNVSYMPGQAGPSGKRVDARILAEEAKQVGKETAVQPEAILKGMHAFVAKTGDLDTARKLLKDMAVLSKATGTEMEDMVGAAGDVSLAFEGMPDKEKRVLEVMRAISAQGQLGTVEISDMAKYMAKLSASAMQFSGDKTKNIAAMGALAQLSRLGGAASPAEQATSVSSFVNTLKTHARIEEFHKQGVEIYETNAKGVKQMRNPIDIIKDSIRVAGNDPEKFKKMFANIRGERAVSGLQTIFAQAGGGEIGMEAVTKELDRFLKANMSADEATEKFAKTMDTTEAKAAQLDIALSNAVGETLPRIKEAFILLTPVIGKATDSLLGFAKKVGLIEEPHIPQVIPENVDTVGGPTPRIKANPLLGPDLRYNPILNPTDQTSFVGPWNDEYRNTLGPNYDFIGPPTAEMAGSLKPVQTFKDIGRPPKQGPFDSDAFKDAIGSAIKAGFADAFSGKPLDVSIVKAVDIGVKPGPKQAPAPGKSSGAPFSIQDPTVNP